MTTLLTFFRRHPVPTFYVLVFGIGWGAILLIIGGPGAIPGTAEQVPKLFPIVLLAWFAGPSISGVLMTGLVSGTPGLRDLFSRLVRWRVPFTPGSRGRPFCWGLRCTLPHWV